MRGRAGRAHTGGSPRQGLTQMLISSSGWESGTNVLCHLCQPSPPTLHQHRSLLRTAVSRAPAPAVWRAWRIQRRHPRSQRQPAACPCFSPAQKSRLGSHFPDPCERVEEGGFDLPLAPPGAHFFQKWAWRSELGDPGVGRAGPE